VSSPAAVPASCSVWLVDLVGLGAVDRVDQAALVEQIALDKPYVLNQPADPRLARVGLPADKAPYLVALLEQILRQVRAVLPGDARDECPSSHRVAS
jgi:hypothetical protein